MGHGRVYHLRQRRDRDIYGAHHYVKTAEEAAAAAVSAGVDINSGGVYSGHLGKAMSEGLVNESVVDAALRRAFRIRMRLGLFDPPANQPYEHYGPGVVGSAAHHALSLDASRQGLVLLQNGGGALPLRKGRRVAVIGPNARTKALLVGGTGGCGSGTCLSAQVVCKNAISHDDWACVPSILEELTAANAGGSVTFAEGADIHSADQKNAAAAAAAAAAADAVVFVLGGDWQTDHEGMDRKGIDLPGGQTQMVQTVMSAAKGKPSVAVIIHGGPMDVSAVAGVVDGVLDAFYPGMHGARAIADAIFGDANPGGKLPATIYKSAYTKTVSFTEFSMAKPPGRSYRYYNGTDVLFPCFWGLSYTTFAIKWAGTPPKSVDNGGNSTATFSVTVTNTGKVAGDEVILAFWTPVGWVHPVDPSYNALRRQLFGFRRVHLAPGAAATVDIPVDIDLLSQIEADGSRVSAPGAYKVILGRGVGDELSTPFTVRGTRRVLERLPLENVPAFRTGASARDC